MNYKISNNYISVEIADEGAELMSIKSKDGIEYLWQGDSTYWGGRAYNLFPICGRIWDGKYTYEGKVYEGLKSPHGFIRKSIADEVKQDKESLEFIFKSNEKTKAFYPFDFIYSIKYVLDKNKIDMKINVKNLDKKELIFAVGGHPGFNVPLEKGTFEDYFLAFEDGKDAKTIYMSDACFVTDRVDAYKLKCSKRLPLTHNLFDRDAMVFTDVYGSITLKSGLDKRAVKVSFPKEMKYVGIWHSPKQEAPFVAIEPWTSIPAVDGKVDELENKKDMFKLASGKEFNLDWSIEIF